VSLFQFASTEKAFIGDIASPGSIVVPLSVAPRGEFATFFFEKSDSVATFAFAPRGESRTFFSTAASTAALTFAPRGESRSLFSGTDSLVIAATLAPKTESRTFFSVNETGRLIPITLRAPAPSPAPPPPPPPPPPAVSGWTPSEISTRLWLDANEASTFSLLGNSVFQWRDRSGNTRHATQSTSTSRPTRATSSQFGVAPLEVNRSVVYFDGENDHLTFGSGLLNGVTTLTVAMVVTAPGGQVNRAVLGPAGTFGVGLELIYGTGATTGVPQIRLNALSPLSFAGATQPLWSNNNTATISTITITTAQTSAWRNGSTAGTAGAGTGAGLGAVGTYALGLYFSTAQSVKMGLAEFIVAEGVVSTAIRQKLEGYLAHKWGLTGSLPSGHPYKTTVPPISDATANVTVSPAIGGQTTINLAAAPLNLGTFGEWTITPSTQVTVDVKMWGAAGAGGGNHQQTAADLISEGISSIGGAGGYSTGRIVLAANTPYVVRVGQGGARVLGATSGATHLAGGTRSAGGAQGGGYSGIFATSVSQATARLVAGGGGAGGDINFGGNQGGAGGGTLGNDGGTTAQSGGGGSQVAGGSAGEGGANGNTAGSALTGGLGIAINGLAFGGGGGYFGGGGPNVGGAGGGSGFVSTHSSVTSGSTTAGNGATPGNSGDAARAGAGAPASVAGTGGLARGADGRVILTLVS
jgi:hypothetical protein